MILSGLYQFSYSERHKTVWRSYPSVPQDSLLTYQSPIVLAGEIDMMQILFHVKMILSEGYFA